MAVIADHNPHLVKERRLDTFTCTQVTIDTITKPKNTIDLLRLLGLLLETYSGYCGKIPHVMAHLPDLMRTRLFLDVCSLPGDLYVFLAGTLDFIKNSDKDRINKLVIQSADAMSSCIRTFAYYGSHIGSFSKKYVAGAFVIDSIVSGISSLLSFVENLKKFDEISGKIEKPTLRETHELEAILEVHRKVIIFKLVKNALFFFLNLISLLVALNNIVFIGLFMTAKAVGTYVIKVLIGDLGEAVCDKKMGIMKEEHRKILAKERETPTPQQ